MIGVGVFFKLKESCGDECETGDATVFVSKATVDSIGFLLLVKQAAESEHLFMLIYVSYLQVSLLVFLVTFSMGFGPIPWVLNVEMMPPEARVGASCPYLGLS